MTGISIEFLNGLYRRKHEHISAIGYYTEQVKECEARVAAAKTERAKKMAAHQLATWKRCLEGGKDRLLHIEVLIPEYIKTHGGRDR